MKQEVKLGVLGGMGHPTRLLPHGAPEKFKLLGASESPWKYGGPSRKMLNGVCAYG